MNEEEFDIKDANRTYYYSISGKMMPDHESMAAYLLHQLKLHQCHLNDNH